MVPEAILPKRYFITSALPYINGMKHLGNLVGSLLPADVYTRFLRAQGQEVLFICGTDEHGTPAELGALKAKQDIRTYCDTQYVAQVIAYNQFGLSFDYFGRTSSSLHATLTQHFAETLDRRGFLEERTIHQLYSKADQRFLPDRYVLGTCPHCGYEEARGDQCDKCCSTLDPQELINPYSAISGSRDLELRETKHLFLKQTAQTEELSTWIHQASPSWPKLVSSIAQKWLTEGLRDRCITRDLSWGVPVSQPGFEGKVFYVWFDAPIGYLSAVQEWAQGGPNRVWEDFCYEGRGTYHVQFMAKDNVAFHTISYPATLLGSGEPWKKVDMLKGLNWLNYYGDKFSTSRNYGIFLDQALETFPADYWRYALMANAPENHDVSFTWESFATTVNKELADLLGNFLQRVGKLVDKYCGGAVPTPSLWQEPETTLMATVHQEFSGYKQALTDLQFRKATQSLRSLWKMANEYFTANEPWTLVTTDPERAATVLNVSVNLIAFFSVISDPFIPFSAALLRKAFNLPSQTSWDLFSPKGYDFLPPHQALTFPQRLFTKITGEEIARLKNQFGGNPA